VQKLVVEHFILNLGLVSLQFFIHAVPALSIAEGDHPVQIVVRQLRGLKLSSFDKVVQRGKRLEEGGEVAALSGE
jgi:hypothetical protein